MIHIDQNDEIFVGDSVLQNLGECLHCGLCCRCFDSLSLYEEEIDEISNYLDIDQEFFIKEYMVSINERFALKSPCPFQKDNFCQIYEKRGLICRTFPFCMNLTKNIAVLTGIYTCPQATQFYEHLLFFYKCHQPDVYDTLLEREKQLSINGEGMKIVAHSSIFSVFLDWLYCLNQF